MINLANFEAQILNFLSGSKMKQSQHDSGYHSVNSEIRRYLKFLRQKDRQTDKRGGGEVFTSIIDILVYQLNEVFP